MIPQVETNRVDGYNQSIGPGVPNLKGYLLEKISKLQHKDGEHNKVIRSKETFFYKEAVVYPFSQTQSLIPY